MRQQRIKSHLENALISFIGRDHYTVFDREMVDRMAHSAMSVLGYHLQRCRDLVWYFSENFVGQHNDLAWGVYEGE